jgi:hypothetical protein
VPPRVGRFLDPRRVHFGCRPGYDVGHAVASSSAIRSSAH